jgi:hypothetical protein
MKNYSTFVNKTCGKVHCVLTTYLKYEKGQPDVITENPTDEKDLHL